MRGFITIHTDFDAVEVNVQQIVGIYPADSKFSGVILHMSDGKVIPTGVDRDQLALMIEAATAPPAPVPSPIVEPVKSVEVVHKRKKA